MDITAITSLIGSVGFPIVACIYMAKFQSTTIKELTEVISKNTVAIERLQARLDVHEDE